MKSPINSSVVIAKLLHSEGWTEYVAACVRHYWKRRICNETDRAKDRIKQLEAAFHDEVSANLTAAQKQIMGKFISLRERMGFDAGFRVGFMTSLYPEVDLDGNETKQEKVLK